MAPYAYDPNLDDEENNQVQLAGGASSASDTELASGASPTSDGTPKQNSQKSLNTGSGFQNLDKYLQTNQSSTIGQDMLGKVGQTVNSARDNQAKASEQFKSQVDSANTAPNQLQVVDAIANPDASKAKDFQGWMNQTYQGPKNLGETQDAWNQYWSGTNQAQAQAKQLGSESGRFSLLDSYFGRPQYGFGEKSLDNLLVQQSGLGGQTQALQNEATSLRGQGNQQQKQLQDYASQQAGKIDQSRTMVNDAYRGAQSQVQSDLTNSLGNANAQRLRDQQLIQNALEHPESMNQSQFNQLGIGDKNLYDLNPANYLTLNKNPLNAEQVATPEQRARIQALSQLGGQTSTLGDAQDMTNAYTFNKDQLASDQAGRKSLSNQLQNDLSNQNLLSAVNVGRGDITEVPIYLPSNDLATNISFIKDQINQESNRPNGNQAKVKAMQDMVNKYNQYLAVNTGKQFVEGTVTKSVPNRPYGGYNVFGRLE